MRDLRCMSFTSKATSEILVAGVQDTMFVIDTNKGEVVKRVGSSCCCRAEYWLNSSRYPPHTTT
jgi:hypothetical protein